MIKNTISDPFVFFFLEMQRTTKVEFSTRVNPIISYCLICTHYCRTLLKCVKLPSSYCLYVYDVLIRRAVNLCTAISDEISDRVEI